MLNAVMVPVSIVVGALVGHFAAVILDRWLKHRG